MNCESMHQHLADYLGDELDPQARREIDEHLAACEACRELVSGLAAAQRAIISQAPSVSQSHLAIAALEFPASAAIPLARPAAGSPVWTLAKIAAMLALAFALGYLARGGPGVAGSPTGNGLTSAAIDDHTPPRFPTAYAEAAQRFPGKSGLAWGLLSLARR